MGNATYTFSPTGVSTATNLPIARITGLYPNTQYVWAVNLQIGINVIPTSLQIGCTTSSVVSILRLGGIKNSTGTWDFFGNLGGKSDSTGAITIYAIKPSGVVTWQLSSILGNLTNTNTFVTYQKIIATIGT